MKKQLIGRLLAALLATAGFSVESLASAEDLFVRKHFVEARDYAARSTSLDDLSILGWSQFMLEDYGAAEQSFRKLAKSWPNDFDVKLGLAWVGIKMGKLDDAAVHLKEAEPLTVAWQAYQVEDAKGWLALKKGDLAGAEKHFTTELGMASAAVKADAYVGLGWLAFNRGDLTKAAAAFQAGLERDTKCFFCKDGLARIALAKNKPADALKHVQEGIRITSDSVGLNSLLTSVLIALNDPAQSVKIYQELVSRYPKTHAYRNGLGYSLLAAGKSEAAQAEFQQVLKADAGNAVALAGLGSLQIYKTEMVKDGWAAYYKGDYESALRLFEAKQAEAAAKHNPSAADGRGWTLLALGKPREAREAFRAAIAMDADFYFSRSGLTSADSQLLTTYRQAWALVDLQRYDEATARFVKARGETPADLHWLIQDGLGWIAFHKKDYDTAEKLFNAVLDGNKDAYLSLNGLGWVALQRNDFAAAGRLIARALVMNPYQVAASYTSAAQRLTDAGQFKDAQEILALGERVYPYSADIHYLMARTKAGLNDDGGAGLSLARAAELAPLYIEPAFDKLRLAANGRQTALLSLAWSLYYAGAADAAVARFTQYNAINGGATTGLTGLGWAQLARKKLPEANKAFQAAWQKGDKGDANAGMGWVLLGLGDTAGAERSFKAALKVLPFHASAQSGLATVQFQKTVLVKDGWNAYYKGDYKGALAGFEAKKAEAASAGNPAAEDGRGWALLALGEAKAAAAAFTAALRIDADYYSSQSGQIAAKRADLVLYQQAWAKLEAGQFADAKTRFEQARADSPPDYQWLIDDGLAWMAFYKKDYDAAEKAFKSIVAATPHAYLSHKGLGYALTERKQYAPAAKALVAAYTLAPYQGILSYTAPGLKMIEAGAHADAKDVLLIGERAYPYSADIQFLLARAFAGLRDETSAGKKAAAAAALAPLYIDPALARLNLSAAASRDALTNLAWGLYFAGDPAKALKRFGEAAKAGASDPNIGRGTAFALYRQGKLKEAIPLLEEAMKHEPKSLLPVVETVPIPGTQQYWTIEYSAGTTLAWAHYKLGDAARADKLFAAALETSPFSIDALTGRGYTRLMLKDAAAARGLFEQALKISPAYPDARQGMEAAKKL